MIDSGYRFVDHTADVAVELWAPSEEALLVEAARAVIDVITESASLVATSDHSIDINASDAEDRLVRWLNEVLWLAIGKGFLLTDADVTLREDGLHAVARGRSAAAELVVTEIKSATYHDLRLTRESSGRFVAHVVLDV